MTVIIRDAIQNGLPYGYEAVLFDATGQQLARAWERYAISLLLEHANQHWPGVPITIIPEEEP